ncbi:hypothetical protein GCM10010176_107650 [Nonomuraea spiralis]|nr:hypothetical protein GCM10010176_107650 [Nonomuraea spiralis]
MLYSSGVQQRRHPQAPSNTHHLPLDREEDPSTLWLAPVCKQEVRSSILLDSTSGNPSPRGAAAGGEKADQCKHGGGSPTLSARTSQLAG